LEQAKAISLASFSPSKNQRNGRRHSLLAAQYGLDALFNQFHSLFAHPVNQGNAGFSRTLTIRLSLHPSLAPRHPLSTISAPLAAVALGSFVSGLALRVARALPRFTGSQDCLLPPHRRRSENHQILLHWLKRAPYY
jgi:hypothetical protein